MKINYQKELEKILEKTSYNEDNKKMELMLHSCCAPCSSYVLEYLSTFFDITVFYFNPNIYPNEEFNKRAEEQERFIKAAKNSSICYILGEYENSSKEFFQQCKGLENDHEGGMRCYKCYEQRLRETAKLAREKGSDYFTTTLSISPHKDSGIINKIGEEISLEFGIKFLPSDFKKKDGYKRSIQLSKEFSLYRQSYCGCIFSMER